MGQKLSEARKLMQVNQIHHVPVVNGTKLVGLLSAVDLASLSLTSFGSDQPFKGEPYDENEQDY